MKKEFNGTVLYSQEARGNPVALIIQVRVQTHYWWAPLHVVNCVRRKAFDRYLVRPTGRMTFPDFLLADVALECGFDVADVVELMSGRPYRS